jgi:uncharacterized membrane protein SirB2
MQPIHLSLILHFIGVGMIFTTVLAGWILTGQYKRANDYKTKSQILKSLRPIGLLSPVTILVMLASGIGNMYALHMGVFSASWLTTKLIFFAIMAINGIIFGAKSAKRGKLVAQVAGGSAPTGTENVIAAMDKQQLLFYVVQSLLLLIILTLSVVKPG